MDTQKMIAEIKSACSVLERRKEELAAKIKGVDDKLSAYRMAIDSLELTVADEKPTPVPENPSGNTMYKPTSIVEFNGQKKKCSEWSKALGLSYCAVSFRLNSGWTVADALTKGRTDGKKKPAPVSAKVFAYDAHDNVIRQYAGAIAAARDLKMPENVVRSTIANVSPEDQLSSRGYYLAYAK